MGDRPVGWHHNDLVGLGILLPRPCSRQESLDNPTANVRFWLKADIPACADQCPLSGVKRTSGSAFLTSANDPKRTSILRGSGRPKSVSRTLNTMPRSPACITVFVAGHRCSRPRRSSIPGPTGPASGRPFPKTPSRPGPTSAMRTTSPKWCARAATRTWGTSSRTGPNLPAYAIVLTASA